MGMEYPQPLQLFVGFEVAFVFAAGLTATEMVIPFLVSRKKTYTFATGIR
jgi:hypothetical protein